MSRPEEPADCCAVVEQMHLFFDEELTEVAAHAIRIHVSACEDCEDCFDAEAAVRATIRRCLCSGEAPPALRARLSTMHVRLEPLD